MAAKYDCAKCIAYCCSVYDEVKVTPFDASRLARHFKVSVKKAKQRYTKVEGGVRMLRRRRDHLLGEACAFLDKESRACTIYDARPRVCRTWPEHGDGCVYYDLVEFERRQQEDENFYVLVQLRPFDKKLPVKS